MVIVDSKGIQNADTTREKGYDGGKKTGMKLHLGGDVLGLPHAMMLTTADVGDRDGALQMMDYYCDMTKHFSHVKKILVDGGYTGKKFARPIKSPTRAEALVAKRNELHTFSVILKR